MLTGYPRAPLRDFLEFFNGKSVKAADTGAYPVYGSNGRIGFADEYKYANAIILGRVGAYCGSVEYCVDRFWASDNTIVVKPKANVAEIRFLYYLLRELDLNRHAGGAAQPLLTQTTLKEVQAPLPPIHVQRKIASVLSAYDDLIENNTRRIAILEEMAQAIYREWFVNFRFPGHENVKLVDSSLGKIPEGWEVTTVEPLVKRLSVGKKYNNKTVAPKGAVPVLDQGKSGIIGYHDEEPGLVATEDNPVIVFANHTCYQRIIHFPFSAIQNVLPFVPNPACHRNLYWLHWATKDVISFNDYKGHWPEFMAKQILLPATHLCESFGEIAKNHELCIFSLQRRNEKLRAARDLLLPKLISGQLDVEELDIDLGATTEELQESNV